MIYVVRRASGNTARELLLEESPEALLPNPYGSITFLAQAGPFLAGTTRQRRVDSEKP